MKNPIAPWASRLILSSLLVWSVPVLRADTAADLDKVTVQLNAEMKAGKHRHTYYTSLSHEVGIKADVLEAQRAKCRLGYGEFYVAHIVAFHSGQPFDVILAERRGKRGWGAIAKAHGIKLGPVVSSARKADKALGQAKAAKAETKKASTPAPKAKLDRGGFGKHGGQATSSSRGGKSSQGGGGKGRKK